MISEEYVPIEVDSGTAEDSTNNSRMYKTARRRSLSGSAVPSKIGHRRVNFGFKKDKPNAKDKNKYDSTDTILSELENMDKSIDSLSSSSGINVSDTCRKSNSSDNSAIYYNDHRRKCHSVSAKMKIKHFLAEHIVRTHPCHHPEYHFHKKDSESNMSIFHSRNTCPNESDFAEYSSRGSTDTSSSKEVSSPIPPSCNEINLINNSFAITSNILDRIRHINIQGLNVSIKSDEPAVSDNINEPKEDESNSSVILDSLSDFPFPEPNPCKLPQVTSPSSIAFATKQILNNKPKRQRLAHSISYDPDYRLADLDKCSNMKRLNHAMSLCPEFIPEKDKWEKKISGYLDTSTPTGAALTAINFGLKRVTETDKFLMITKSPTSCPNEFLEDGISHVGATSAIYQSLMRHSTCYDVMPDSGKVVIIDSQMQIGRAFDAIEDNIVRASPIWSSEKQGFIALLTVNDLVPLLMHLHQQQTGDDHCCEQEGSPQDFSTITVEKCLSVIPRFRSLQNHVVGVTPETNLHAVNVMFNKLHKSMVLVIDSYLSGNPLFLLSGLRTLTYLFYKAHTVSLESCFKMKIHSSKLLANQHFEVLKPLMDTESPCQSLCVSSPGKPQYLVYLSSSIIDVLRAIAGSYNCCALIIDNKCMDDESVHREYIIKDVITMADILNLVKIQKHRDGQITAKHILAYRTCHNEPLTYRDPVVNCSVNDSIQHLIDLVVKEKASFALVHSAEVEHSSTLGILTAHDILSYIDSLPSDVVDRHCRVSSFQGIKNERLKKSHSKDSASKMRSLSDNNYSVKRHTPTILDDSVEEIFDIEFS